MTFSVMASFAEVAFTKVQTGFRIFRAGSFRGDKELPVTYAFVPPEHFIWDLAGILVVSAALSCAIHLHLFSLQKTSPSPPIATILIIGITTLISGLQFIFPEILSEFRRNRGALMTGEWWRIVTPLFVQAGGWKQCFFNLSGALIVCPLVEKLYGKKLLALYFLPGVLGEIFAYKWNPDGAGSSLGIAGVIGGLFAFALLHHQEVPGFLSIFSIFGFLAAIVLCLYRDIHGPPILIGVLLAGLMKILWPTSPWSGKQSSGSGSNRESGTGPSCRSS